MRTLSLGVVALLYFVPSALAQETLPKGAVAKFGSHLFRHPERTGNIDFSPDGSLASGGEDGTVIIWDTTTGFPKKTFQIHEGQVECLSFSHDGKLLASCSSGEVAVTETNTGRSVWKHRLKNTDPQNIGDVKFAKKSKILIHYGNKGFIQIWETKSGKLLFERDIDDKTRTFSFPVDGRISVSPDGKYVAFNRKIDKPSFVLDLNNYRELDPQKLGLPERVEFLSDPNSIFTRQFIYDNEDPEEEIFKFSISLWKKNSNKSARTVTELQGTRSPFHIKDYAVHTQNAKLAIVSEKASLLLYRDDIKVDGDFLEHGTGNPRRTHILDLVTGQSRLIAVGDKDVTDVAFSHDGKTLATASPDSIRIWNVASGKERFLTKGHQREIDRVKFSPNGKLLASSSNDGVFVWDVQKKKLHRKSPFPYFHHISWPTDLAFDNDSNWIWVIGYSGSYYFQMGGSNRYNMVLIPLNWRRGIQRCISFSPGNKPAVGYINPVRAAGVSSGYVSSGFPSSIRLSSGRSLWVADDFPKMTELPFAFRGDMDVYAVQFSQDEEFLAVAGKDKKGTTPVVRLYKTSTGNFLRKFTISNNKEDQIRSICILPDSSSIVVAGNKFSRKNRSSMPDSYHGLIEIWDFTLAKRITTLEASSPVRCVACSPDGTLIAAACKDNLARIYNAKTGKLIAKLEGHRGPVRSVAFSPDGKQIATGSADTTVMLWDIEKVLKK